MIASINSQLILLHSVGLKLRRIMKMCRENGGKLIFFVDMNLVFYFLSMNSLAAKTKTLIKPNEAWLQMSFLKPLKEISLESMKTENLSSTFILFTKGVCTADIHQIDSLNYSPVLTCEDILRQVESSDKVKLKTPQGWYESQRYGHA